MTPFYATDRVRLYLGEAGEVLPELLTEQPAVVLTDPPYFYWGHICKTDEQHQLDFDREASWMLDVLLATLTWLPAIRFVRPSLALIFAEPHYLGIYMRVARYLKWPMVGWWPSLRGENEEYLVAFSDTWESGWPIEAGRMQKAMPTVLQGNSYGQGKSVNMLREILYMSPNGAVWDPFCGTGSTVVAALRNGRTAVGIEMDADIAHETRVNLSVEA